MPQHLEDDLQHLPSDPQHAAAAALQHSPPVPQHALVVVQDVKTVRAAAEAATTRKWRILFIPGTLGRMVERGKSRSHRRDDSEGRAVSGRTGTPGSSGLDIPVTGPPLVPVTMARLPRSAPWNQAVSTKIPPRRSRPPSTFRMTDQSCRVPRPVAAPGRTDAQFHRLAPNLPFSDGGWLDWLMR